MNSSLPLCHSPPARHTCTHREKNRGVTHQEKQGEQRGHTPGETRRTEGSHTRRNKDNRGVTHREKQEEQRGHTPGETRRTEGSHTERKRRTEGSHTRGNNKNRGVTHQEKQGQRGHTPGESHISITNVPSNNKHTTRL